MNLPRLLELVPVVYVQLGDALVPVRASEPPDTSPNPLHKPAPARLDVAEHRHQLLRGLRWWVDAVTDADERPAGVGESPAKMCALLLAHLRVMAAEDREELARNLFQWLGKAQDFMGEPEQPTASPDWRSWSDAALDAPVPVAVAAKALGLAHSTVWRRAAGKKLVTIREVATDRRTREHRAGPAQGLEPAPLGARCDRCDLPADQCAHAAH